VPRLALGHRQQLPRLLDAAPGARRGPADGSGAPGRASRGWLRRERQARLGAGAAALAGGVIAPRRLVAPGGATWPQPQPGCWSRRGPTACGPRGAPVSPVAAIPARQAAWPARGCALWRKAANATGCGPSAAPAGVACPRRSRCRAECAPARPPARPAPSRCAAWSRLGRGLLVKSSHACRGRQG
jgi:hypothetical protein